VGGGAGGARLGCLLAGLEGLQRRTKPFHLPQALTTYPRFVYPHACPSELMASSPKLSGIDLSKLLTPAATLRPRAAQRCVTKQVRRPACAYGAA
jgi:hypothetical protein